MTDLTTAELVERVRDGIQGDEDDPTMYVQDAYAALTTLASRCEELERDRDGWKGATQIGADQVEETEAALARAKAELRECQDLRDTAVKNWRETETLLRAADAALEAVGARVEELTEQNERMALAISDALGRYQVTHIHEGLREAMKDMP